MPSTQTQSIRLHSCSSRLPAAASNVLHPCRGSCCCAAGQQAAGEAGEQAAVAAGHGGGPRPPPPRDAHPPLRVRPPPSAPPLARPLARPLAPPPPPPPPPPAHIPPASVPRAVPPLVPSSRCADAGQRSACTRRHTVLTRRPTLWTFCSCHMRGALLQGPVAVTTFDGCIAARGRVSSGGCFAAPHPQHSSQPWRGCAPVCSSVLCHCVCRTSTLHSRSSRLAPGSLLHALGSETGLHRLSRRHPAHGTNAGLSLLTCGVPNVLPVCVRQQALLCARRASITGRAHLQPRTRRGARGCVRRARGRTVPL